MTPRTDSDALAKLLADAVDGPWEAALERGCHGVIAHSLPEGGSNFVAVVSNDENTPDKEPSRFANARLIALAPDLARELIALRKERDALKEALQAVERFVPVEVVRCRGDKCREPWCESCYGEDLAEKGLQDAIVDGAKARAALATEGKP